MRYSRFSKYNARGATLNGFYFQSIGELHRYEELLLAQKAGAITKLKVHPRYPLEVNNVLIATYVADFDYFEEGVLVTEDFKGYETEVFRLKKKLWEAIYGRQLRITRGK